MIDRLRITRLVATVLLPTVAALAGRNGLPHPYRTIAHFFGQPL